MKRDVLLMHERSVFRTPPDFTVLAEKYFDFSQHVTYNTLGKAKLDFKDADSQRALSKTLLKHFFDLDVRLPPGRLVPAVPQRLNYLLWVQDLVEKVLNRNDNVVALDVGTGASCVLALLGHRQCGWDFVGTETDPAAATPATENVSRNNLEEHVKVLEVGSLVEAVEKSESRKFDVCVCNPPFFASAEEADAKTKAKEQGRASPPSDMGGVEAEKVWASSGEVGFFKDVLLRDSLVLRDKIGLYTCMLGKNGSVKEVLSALQNKVKSCRVAEFHQGKTTRYAVAWTFLNVNLQKLPYSKVRQQKQQTKIELVLPHSQVPVTLRVHYVWRELLSALNSIEVPYEIINEGQNMCHLWVKAKENTWTHLRRRRREIERKRRLREEEAKKAEEAKNPKEEEPSGDQQTQDTQQQEQSSEAAAKNDTSEAETSAGTSDSMEEGSAVDETTAQPVGSSEESSEMEVSEQEPAESSSEPAEKEELAAEPAGQADQQQAEPAAPSQEVSSNGPSQAELGECSSGPAEEQEAAPESSREESSAVSSGVENPSSAVTSSNHVPPQPDVDPTQSSEQSASQSTADEAMEADSATDGDGHEQGAKRKQADESAVDEPPSKVSRQDDSDKSFEENADDMAAEEGFGGTDPEPDSSPLLLSTDVRVRRVYTDIVIHMTIRSGQSDVAHQLLQYIKNSLWGV
ncbi:RNA N(6)-adenosine-methyltransferase mettl16 [Dermacentor albipictus]|uniref:RNA N(6)-adenosine-methyltransferase mettl16 n=1 Tax=Dermacentor albipictus TaxID=60249 RepID=UPI0038FC0AC7